MKKTLAVFLAVLMAMTCVLVSCGEKNHPDAIKAAEDLNSMLGEVSTETGGMMTARAEAKGTGVVVTMEIPADVLSLMESSGMSVDDLMSEFSSNPFDDEMGSMYPAVDSITIMLKDSTGKVHFEKTFTK